MRTVYSAVCTPYIPARASEFRFILLARRRCLLSSSVHHCIITTIEHEITVDNRCNNTTTHAPRCNTTMHAPCTVHRSGGFDQEVLDIPTAHKLHEDITKIQTMILVLSDRLESLESAAAAAASGATAAGRSRSGGSSGGSSGGGGSGSGGGRGGAKRARTNKQGRR